MKLGLMLVFAVACQAQVVSGLTCPSKTITPGPAITCNFTISAPATAGQTVGPFTSSDPGLFVGPATSTMVQGGTGGSLQVWLVQWSGAQTVSVIPPPGSTAQPWVLTVIPPTSPASTKTATVGSVTITFTLPSTPITLSSVTCNKTTLNAGDVSNCTATISAAAPSGGYAITPYTADAPLVLAPASLTVAAGATSVAFTVTRPSGT